MPIAFIARAAGRTSATSAPDRHYGGNFPVWLSPEQGAGYPITDDHHMPGAWRRTWWTMASARISIWEASAWGQIRAAQLMKVPMVIVGGQEAAAAETLAVRYRDGEQRNDVPLAEFAAHVQKRIRTRSAEL